MTTPSAPPPPAAPPPAVSGSARTAIRVVIVAFAVVAMLGTVGLLTAAAIGVGTTRVISDSRSLPANMRSLTISADDAGAEVRITADPKATQPRADLRLIGSSRVDNRLQVVTEADGARLSIGEQAAPWFRWKAGTITVVLPPDLARRLTVTTTLRAGVVSAQADLDQLIVHNRNGVVRLEGAARRVDVDVRNGSVSTEDPVTVTESFRATTVNGDIEAQFNGAPPRVIEATTRNGDVTIEVAGPGPYMVNAQADDRHGDTTVTVPQTTNAATAASQITVRSETGDVEVVQLS